MIRKAHDIMNCEVSNPIDHGPICEAALSHRIAAQRARITFPLCNEGFTWQRDVAKGESVGLAEGLGATTWNGALVHIECAKLAERKTNAVEA